MVRDFMFVTQILRLKAETERCRTRFHTRWRRCAGTRGRSPRDACAAYSSRTDRRMARAATGSVSAGSGARGLGGRSAVSE
ncbi:unnamed protein product [Pieris macdunnoughi]|uniref:Uncharacterized protein n=1 Tax=Pieris macdunnoughi TaxID=345717 RepID=A0A821S6I4_9NEOP|nr:unnamed protein product [Pieris macdunnoughi]